MRRVTLRIPEQQIEKVEALVDAGEFPNRSEAIRAGIRELLDESYEPLTPAPRIPQAAQPYVPDDGDER